MHACMYVCTADWRLAEPPSTSAEDGNSDSPDAYHSAHGSAVDSSDESEHERVPRSIFDDFVCHVGDTHHPGQESSEESDRFLVCLEPFPCLFIAVSLFFFFFKQFPCLCRAVLLCISLAVRARPWRARAPGLYHPPLHDH